MSITGCLPVLAIPFTSDELVDEKGLAKIIELNIRSGVDGLTCFGLASELYKLDDGDRLKILEVIMDTVQGRVPVIVGCEHSGTLAATRRCDQAAKMGAAAVMLLPPSFTVPSEASVRDYFLRCAEAADLPIIIQDAPEWTGVSISTDQIRELNAADSRICAIKIESPPISRKSIDLRESGLSIIAGYGAIHLFEDVYLGSIDGFMPGCAFPEVMVHAWHLASNGRLWELESLNQKILPLLAAQLTDLDTFIEVQKRVLIHRGVLDSLTCREPHKPIDDSRLNYLTGLINNVLMVVEEIGTHGTV